MEHAHEIPISGGGRRPNWLLRGLVCVSLGIHVAVFIHISGIYRSKTMTYIELTLKDISRPAKRSIPRPRPRPRARVEPLKSEPIRVVQPVFTRPKPMKVDPAEANLPDTLMETVARPEIPRVQGVSIAKWSPPEKAPVKEAPVKLIPAEASPAPVERASPDFATSSSYLEMVKLKIERYKKYPETARVERIEGSVTVRFKIRPSGDVSGVRVIKTSNHDELDHAALKAVKDAAPFPRPPERFFKGAIALKLTIVFELT